MKNEINIVKSTSFIPLEISIIQFDSLISHIHTNAQLIIVLDGEFTLEIDKQVFDVKKGDIFMINPRITHRMSSTDKSLVLSCIINIEEFIHDSNEANNIHFDLNSMVTPNHHRYASIKYLISSIVKLNTMENFNSIYTNRAIAFSLFAQLMNDFKVDVGEKNFQNTSVSAINQITAYINDHYQEKLTLSSLATTFNYSIAYLSRLFKSSLGTNFMTYYNHLRVNYCVEDLLHTNNSINVIAENNGFESPKSFVHAFKGIYNMYPSEFRSQFKAQTVSEPIDLSALKKEALDIIIDYYNEYNFTHGETYERTRKTQNLIDVNYTDKLTPIRMVATNLLEINDTKKIFDEEIKKNIISIQKDIKFKNILLSDLFDNGLHLFYVDELGEKKLSIVIFKRIISFLEENDLKPYFKFVYNPYYMELNEYKEYCSIFIDYIRLNFTRDYLNSWMISFSCIDNIKSRLRYDFYLTSKELYIQLKKITKNILFGTPTFTKYAIMNTSALDEYLSFCATNNITYDFLSVSYLSNDKNYLQVDKDELKEFINFLRNKNQFKENALCIENFNFTASDNLLNDTLYASSYLCKNIIDNVKSLFALSKASLCDLYLSSSTDPFDGKNGMITYNSIKKASYNVYILISKLGPQLLKKSQNYIITLKDNKIIILVNNYNHYSKLYAENEYYFISKTSRYTCFPKSTDIIFQFSINGIPYKKCKIKTTYLNTTSGSSYDKTLSLGDIELFDDHDFENLKSISEMNFKLETQNIENQVLKIETTLSPLETQLIEIELL